MKHKTLAQFLATAYVARANCERSGNADWLDRWEERIERACELLPSGSGFDSGTTCDGVETVVGAERLVFRTSYHHMGDHGMYIGWSEWLVTVTPDWHGVSVRAWLQSDPVMDPFSLFVGCEEYIGDTFAHVLDTLVDAEGARV